MGTNVKMRRVDLAKWDLQTSPKFITGIKYQFHKVFDQIRDPEIPITLHPLIMTRDENCKQINIYIQAAYFNKT